MQNTLPRITVPPITTTTMRQRRDRVTLTLITLVVVLSLWDTPLTILGIVAIVSWLWLLAIVKHENTPRYRRHTDTGNQ